MVNINEGRYRSRSSVKTICRRRVGAVRVTDRDRRLSHVTRHNSRIFCFFLVSRLASGYINRCPPSCKRVLPFLKFPSLNSMSRIRNAKIFSLAPQKCSPGVSHCALAGRYARPGLTATYSRFGLILPEVYSPHVRRYAQNAGGGGGGGFSFNMMMPQQQKGDALKEYSVDLTEMARNGKLDPTIGRDEGISVVFG